MSPALPVQIRITHTDGRARSGVLQTPHGEIQTPFFMAVGTAAAVKGMTPGMLRECGAQLVLGNTYHLAVRPGEEIVQHFGGLAKFMGWNGPTLTDSGGYQAFSLAQTRRLSDEGVWFRNHIDGAELNLTPERSVQIQQALGADIFMALDECPPADATHGQIAAAVERTRAWALRCREAWTHRETQALFGIVQGGRFDDLRQESAGQIVEMDFPGNAIGGVSVGESPEEMARIVDLTTPLLPEDKPRYLMGVGHPSDMLHAINCGIDMFDCVIPTRHARHAQVMTDHGPLNLRNACYRKDKEPFDAGCDCLACRTVTRGYVRHLFHVKEMLGPIYATLHNLRYYYRLFEQARAAIQENRFAAFHQSRLAALTAAD